MNAVDLPRCKLLMLDASNLERAADDPGLALLLAEGRTVIAQMTILDGTGGPDRVGLLLAPPRTGAEHATVLVLGTVIRDMRIGTSLVLVLLVFLLIVLSFKGAW